MNRIIFILSAAMVLCAIGAFAQSESLGDYAREVRKEKKPAAKKTFTNDNLPNGGPLSVVGSSGSAPATDEKDADKAPAKDSKDKKSDKASEKKTGANADALKAQIAEQKQKILDAARELDLLQREYKLQLAAFYGDAGTQLRDSRHWTEQEIKFRSDIAEKQKQIEDGKAKLEALQEQARQAGLRNTD